MAQEAKEMTYPTTEERAKALYADLIDLDRRTHDWDHDEFVRDCENLIAQSLRAAAEQARREENEACAQVADGVDSPLNTDGVRYYARGIAERIRSRIAQKDGGGDASS